jgi:hypothetical protein
MAQCARSREFVTRDHPVFVTAVLVRLAHYVNGRYNINLFRHRGRLVRTKHIAVSADDLLDAAAYLGETCPQFENILPLYLRIAVAYLLGPAPVQTPTTGPEPPASSAAPSGPDHGAAALLPTRDEAWAFARDYLLRAGYTLSSNMTDIDLASRFLTVWCLVNQGRRHLIHWNETGPRLFGVAYRRCYQILKDVCGVDVYDLQEEYYLDRGGKNKPTLLSTLAYFYQYGGPDFATLRGDFLRVVVSVCQAVFADIPSDYRRSSPRDAAAPGPESDRAPAELRVALGAVSGNGAAMNGELKLDGDDDEAP